MITSLGETGDSRKLSYELELKFVAKFYTLPESIQDKGIVCLK
jgi:hypothetical protein